MSSRSGAARTLLCTIWPRLVRIISMRIIRMRITGAANNTCVDVICVRMMVRILVGHTHMVRAPGWAATCRALPLGCAGYWFDLRFPLGTVTNGQPWHYYYVWKQA